MSRRHPNNENKPRSSMDHASSRGSKFATSRPPLEGAARETHAGEEPGINLRRKKQKERHLKQDCTIEVVEYSQDTVNFKILNNAEFVELMNQPTFQPMHTNIPSPPSTVASSSTQGPDHDTIHEQPRAPVVRWINIGGLDWDVISAVGLKYHLHPLALEDVLHEQGHSQSKADYYNEHLFIRVVCHTLEEDPDDSASVEEPFTRTTVSPREDEEELNRGPCHLSPVSSEDSALERGQLAREKGYANDSSSILELKGEDDVVDESRRKKILKGPKRYLRRRINGLSGFLAPGKEKQMLRIKALTKGDRVNVRHEPMSIFLFRDGTVITFHPHPTLEFTNPITERLHDEDSVLRTSEDASLLVESLLDLVVDRILEIMDEYQDKIHKLEHDVLLKPNMSAVRSLHILSGDLILHKRTLDPIKTMIWGLRRYDLDRCVALVDSLEEEADRVQAMGTRHHSSRHRVPKHHEDDETMAHLVPGPASTTSGVPGTSAGSTGTTKLPTAPTQTPKAPKKAVGYLSYKTKVYLADVYDHIDFVLTSLEMFSGLAENLINFAFNMSSNEMNQVMARLTLVTIIFLPLTLLTGYFGMNFEHFSAISNSDLFFWKIALPLMCVLIPMFMYSDIYRLLRYIRKVLATRQMVKQYGYDR